MNANEMESVWPPSIKFSLYKRQLFRSALTSISQYYRIGRSVCMSYFRDCD